MIDSDYEESQITSLKCGCTIHEISGELYEECLPHRKADFIQ